MRSYASQFQNILDSDRVPSHIILFGKEPGLIQINSDKLKKMLTAKGYEREFILIDNPNQFDWSILLMKANSPSLFNSCRFFDIYLPNLKIKNEGAKLLLKLTTDSDPNIIWMIRTNEVESATQKSAWWQAWEKKGIVVQHPALNTDKSLYSVFELCDFALQGQTQTVLKTFDILAKTPTEMPLLIWALNKTLNEIIILAIQPANFDKLPIWANRRAYYYQALKRLTHKECLNLLEHLFQSDLCFKSGQKMSAYHLLLNVLLHLSGKKIFI